MGQLTINTLDQQDIKTTMEALFAISKCDNIELGFCPIQEFNDVRKELSSILEEYEKCERNYKQCDDALRTEHLNNENLKKENERFQKEKQELENKIKELTDQNDLYKEELCKTKIGYNTSYNNEILYFNISDDNTLKQTISNTAYYKAIKNKDSNEYEFEFNEEKASHNCAISQKEKFLHPFCEVSKNVVPNANYVSNKYKGIFIMQENASIEVKEKAKVELIQKHQ